MCAQYPHIRHVIHVSPRMSCEKSPLQIQHSEFGSQGLFDLLGHQIHYLCQINSFLTISIVAQRFPDVRLDVYKLRYSILGYNSIFDYFPLPFGFVGDSTHFIGNLMEQMKNMDRTRRLVIFSIIIHMME